MNEIWTKSIREEIIGVLWLIFTVLLFLVHAHWFFVILPLFQGVTSIIAAIYWAGRESAV